MDDEIDARRAPGFRWRLPEAADSVDEDPTGGPPADEDPSARAARDCAALARHVTQVWSVTRRATQARAMAALAERVEQVGFGLSALAPDSAMALATLYARHWKVLPPAARRSALRLSRMTVDPAGLPELLVTVAATGNRQMSVVVLRALRDSEYALPGLAGRLGALLTASRDPEVVELSVVWLAVCDEAEAVPWVRAAMRLPSVACRMHALHIGVQRPGELLRVEDVVWLVEDALVHPLPTGVDHRGAYEDALAEAIRVLRPEAAVEPLLRLLAGEMRTHGQPRIFLGQAWALRALAAGWPEHALPHVDAWLGSAAESDRVQAIRATAGLPDEPARQRLLRAAGDSAHRVRSGARAEYERRFEEPYPAEAEPLA